MSHKRNNIILIGFMGSGKTTFAKWLTENTDLVLCDIDQYIEQKENQSVQNIFSEQGEAYFRDLETLVLKELNEKLDGYVISVGGGLPIKEENRMLLQKLGQVVYLRTSVDELVKRLQDDTQRPLLAGGDLRNRILSLMEQRQAIYEEVAEVVIETDHQSFPEMYDMLKKERADRKGLEI